MIWKKSYQVLALSFATILVLTVAHPTISVSGNATYSGNGDVHEIEYAALLLSSINGQIGGEWPEGSAIGHIWCTSESDPVGTVFAVHDDDYIYIGIKVTNSLADLYPDGHWISIDWNMDGKEDLKDNMGNSAGSRIALSTNELEYAIPIPEGETEFNILVHARVLGLPSDPSGETTTFPYRDPGKFLYTTFELQEYVEAPPVEEPAVETPPVEDPPGEIPEDSIEPPIEGTVSSPIEEVPEDPVEEAPEMPEDPEAPPEEYKVPEAEVPKTPVENPAEVPVLPDIGYAVEYIDQADETTVNETGIYFYTSGAYTNNTFGVQYNDLYVLPEEDYGTYALYNGTVPVHFNVHLWNNGTESASDLAVIAIQEFHNDVTIWYNINDSIYLFDLYKGQAMDGNSTEFWDVDIPAGTHIVLDGWYIPEGIGWGLDQTHLEVSWNGISLINDEEAGVYCPP